MLYNITKVSQHSIIKPLILNYIDTCEYVNINKSDEKISKTDWYGSNHSPRDYFKYLEYLFNVDMTESYKQLGGSGIDVKNIWFHQYLNNEYYDWHIHPDCHFTNIYYVEHDKFQTQTEFKDPYTKQIFRYDVAEGYVITVPAFVFHRSPPCQNYRKTIIAFNADLLH